MDPHKTKRDEDNEFRDRPWVVPDDLSNHIASGHHEGIRRAVRDEAVWTDAFRFGGAAFGAVVKRVVGFVFLVSVGVAAVWGMFFLALSYWGFRK